MNMNEVIVSICCITYNHEAYIRDAIEGFLAQKTRFRYEIIIHDDASTDKTAEIVKEYEEKYPDLIHGIYESQNQYSINKPSIEWIWKIQCDECRGKYIALCEGDDYWIDIHKLQLQVEYLEMHPECIMTGHNVIDMDYRNYKVSPVNLAVEDGIIQDEKIIAETVAILTSSRVYRKEALYMDSFFSNVGIGDYPQLLYSLTKGSIYYFSRIMSVYRRFHEGSWSISVQDSQLNMSYNIQMIDFFAKYNEYTNRKYEKICINKCQGCVDSIMITNNGKTMKEFLNLCQRCDEELHKACHDIFKKIVRLWLQIFDEDYLDKEIGKFIKKWQRIVIMGAGKYAGVIAKQLKHHEIDFDGFVVSNSQDPVKEYFGKPVWRMKELTTEEKDIGVIIGINPMRWDEIMCALEDAGIVNYICPFLLW